MVGRSAGRSAAGRRRPRPLIPKRSFEIVGSSEAVSSGNMP
jgi:hypothetical protein